MTGWTFLAPLYSGIISLVLGYFVARVKQARTEKEDGKNENMLVKEALAAILFSEMFRIYNQYGGDDDGASIPAKEQKRMKILHDAYHALGYNHEGDAMFSAVMKKTAVVSM